jgi:transposase-like protein
MQQKQLNLMQFQRKFSTEKACREHLFKLRWPEGYRCPRCNHDKYSYHTVRHLYQCKSCKYQVSVTAGTIFHKTRTPLRKWFWMIFLMGNQKSGVSMMSIQKMLSINKYQTVWTMGHKIRHAMSKRDSHYKLAGLVEMDDTYIGSKKKGKQGRGAEGKLKVIVAVETEKNKPRFAKMVDVENMSKQMIFQAFDGRIEKDAVLKTDGWKPYTVLKKDNREHKPVIVGNGEKASCLLPWVHTLISNIKGNIRGTYHGVDKNHISRYLSEFCFRFNRRFWEKQMFNRIINACVNSFTISYAELIG